MDANLKAHYLRLYKEADDILKAPGNPCDIKMIDGAPTCHMSRLTNNDPGYASPTLCCAGCEHHDPEVGCTVESLACKLGWCYSTRTAIEGMSVTDHPVFLKIRAIRHEAYQLGVPMVFRGSVDETFPGVTP